MARKPSLRLSYSNVGMAIGKILQEEQYIKGIKKVEEDGKNFLDIALLYNGKEPSLHNVKLVSTPSAHIYSRKSGVRKTLRDYGTTIVSTNQGMMTGEKAAKLKVGGELICRLS